MAIHQRTLLVPYTTEEMFDLAADVERYPEFVPGYCDARILQRKENILYTMQRVGFGPAQVGFRSEARLDRPHRIEIRSFERPFDALHIDWDFAPVPGGCSISFCARVRLGNGITERFLQAWFDRLAEFIPPAFAKRARELYGQRPGPGPR